MCFGAPKMPELPAMPVPRAERRLPNRGTIGDAARRNITARAGTSAPAGILGAPNRSAQSARSLIPMQRGSSSADTQRMSTVLGG